MPSIPRETETIPTGDLDAPSLMPPAPENHPASERPGLGRHVALPHAQRLAELLRPVCERVEIAGSLRREKDVVSDIEIVAMPRGMNATSLFDDRPAPYAPCEEFAELLHKLRAAGTLRLDPDKRRNGPRYKRFLLPGLQAHLRGVFCLDLFIAGPDNWGNTLAIRTGSAAFSKFLMAQAWSRKRRRQQDGHLWQCLPGDAYDRPVPGGRQKIVCATESDYFAAVGVPFVQPCYRSEATVARLRREGL